MGLSIHYTLTLPAAAKREAVERSVEALRRACAPLPLDFAADAIASDDGTCEWGAVAIPQGRGRVRTMAMIEPRQAVYFAARPGAGCEPVFLGVARHPENPTTRGRWYGQWACKTQYASSPQHGGLDHFVRCHLAVIAMLDEAKRLEFGLKVSDEGGYWTSRRLPRLLATLDRYNRVIARLAGRMKDTFKGSFVAPITKRPDFEHLEAGAKRAVPTSWSPEVRALVRRTRGRLAR